MPERFRNWCFTFNNYSDIDYENLLKDLEAKRCTYYIIGKEVGEKGTPHLQGYCCFQDAKTESAVYLTSSRRIHWEDRKAPDHASAIEYCKKEGNFIEWGKKPACKAGKRTDIDAVKEIVKNGGGMSEIVDVASSYQGMRMGELMLKYKEKKRNWKTKVYWFWGPTGTGKTRYARELLPDAWMSLKNLKWWEGYDAQEGVIVDDFRKDFCTFHELLRILDRYEYRVETKGGSRQLLAKYIIFTCPSHPVDLYNGRSEEDINQLLRRIDEIWYCDLKGWTISDGNTVHSTEVGGNTSANKLALTPTDILTPAALVDEPTWKGILKG